MLPSRAPEASKYLKPSPSTYKITHTQFFVAHGSVFIVCFRGPKWGPGLLRPSGGLCLGLGAAVPTEAESSRVLRGEEGLGTEGPGSFLHSILWMKRGQPEGGTKGSTNKLEVTQTRERGYRWEPVSTSHHLPLPSLSFYTPCY